MAINPVGGGDDDDRPQLGSRDADEFAPSPLPIGPDGGAIPKPGVVGMPEPLPAATPENWVCLRGPCRHYMRMVEAGEFGNPEGTFEAGAHPRQLQHWCLAIPGQYLDMTEGMVFECNRWDPIDEDDQEHVLRERRRSKYLKLHPEHTKAELPDDVLNDVKFDDADAVALADEERKYEATMAAAFAIPPPAPPKED